MHLFCKTKEKKKPLTGSKEGRKRKTRPGKMSGIIKRDQKLSVCIFIYLFIFGVKACWSEGDTTCGREETFGWMQKQLQQYLAFWKSMTWPDPFNYKGLRSCFDVAHNFEQANFVWIRATKNKDKKYIAMCVKDCVVKESLSVSKKNGWPSGSGLDVHWIINRTFKN